MSEWKKGVHVGANLDRAELKKILLTCSRQKYSIKGVNGAHRTVSGPELALEQMFHKGLNGNVKAIKTLLKCATKHLHDPVKKTSRPKEYMTSDITQAHVDMWKASGSLPTGCSEILSEISTSDLNKARKLHIKKEKALEKLAKQSAIVGTFG